MIRPEWREHIRRMVDDWPSVSPETYAQLALLLAPERPPAVEPATVRPQQAAA
ncbi:hypothetical protein ACFY3G_17695 [Streptomyces phaeochromogenes]|uniref:hypothetical protein n=1 Tax=Streptomyces phaeochromogenes TaxID=1923 RepID=UPI0036CD04C9